MGDLKLKPYLKLYHRNRIVTIDYIFEICIHTKSLKRSYINIELIAKSITSLFNKSMDQM